MSDGDMQSRPIAPEPVPLAILATCDMRGIVRGRGFPADAYGDYLEKGCGWVPANQLLSAFDEIAPENPFGSLGDLRLLPDADAHTRVQIPGAPIPLDVTLRCAFGSEFTLFLEEGDTAPAFSLLEQRKCAEFYATLMGMTREAGLEPEMLLAEHGGDQFEITMAPAAPLQSADQVIILREIVRERAWRQGIEATFSSVSRPQVPETASTSILAFTGPNGAPAAYAKGRPGDLSPLAGRFAKGVLDSYHAVCALTASSVLSYERLRPGRWSAGHGVLAMQNREAAFRICPAPTSRHDPARSHHLEFRAADTTACPCLALGAVLHAGTDGLCSEETEPLQENGTPDPARLGPISLEAALDAFEASEAAEGWASPLFRNVFLRNHRNELSRLVGMSPEDVISSYARIY